MRYNPDIHHRRSIRLQGYDYSQAGAYFVTINTQHRERLLCSVEADGVFLSAAGEIVLQTWCALPSRFLALELDAFVIMPDHVHGVIVIGTEKPGAASSAELGAASSVELGAASGVESGAASSVESGAASGVELGAASGVELGAASGVELGAASPTPRRLSTLARVMRTWKSISAIEINRCLGRSNRPVWQRNYYERIIRNSDQLERIRAYIEDNPRRWIRK